MQQFPLDSFFFYFVFSQMMSVMLNLLVKGGNMTLCMASLNFFDFLPNRFLWKTLYLSVPLNKQLRFFRGTSVGTFCCVNKFWNDDANCCKGKMFP